MKKRIICSLLFGMLISGVLRAQDSQDEGKKGFDKSRLFFGGNFGLGFSSYYTLINVSPQVGYHFNQYLAAGTGINFIYSSQRYYTGNVNYDYRFDYGVVGLNVFGRVYPLQQLFLQIQPELNYTWGKEKFYDGSPDQKLSPQFVPSLLAGAGGAIPMGRAGAFILIIQYDLLQNNRTPYGNRPFFSFGYNVGL
jgi:hypothetical protein